VTGVYHRAEYYRELFIEYVLNVSDHASVSEDILSFCSRILPASLNLIIQWARCDMPKSLNKKYYETKSGTNLILYAGKV